jgi:hypothetical protein
MVEHVVDEFPVGGEAGVVPIVDMDAGNLVASLVGALLRLPRASS